MALPTWSGFIAVSADDDLKVYHSPVIPFSPIFTILHPNCINPSMSSRFSALSNHFVAKVWLEAMQCHWRSNSESFKLSILLNAFSERFPSIFFVAFCCQTRLYKQLKWQEIQWQCPAVPKNSCRFPHHCSRWPYHYVVNQRPKMPLPKAKK